MFTVDGYRDGISYQAVVGGDPGGVAGSRTVGVVVSDPDTIAWLEGQAGQPWQASPTGPAGITDLDDPASVLGTLYSETQVTEVDGDAPDLLGTAASGIVY